MLHRYNRYTTGSPLSPLNESSHYGRLGARRSNYYRRSFGSLTQRLISLGSGVWRNEWAFCAAWETIVLSMSLEWTTGVNIQSLLHTF